MRTYIYVIHVKKAWNTSYRQIRRAIPSWARIKEQIKDERLAESLSKDVANTLFGHEHFCEQISGDSILGAIPCLRAFKSKDYRGGGTFSLGDFMPNCHFTSNDILKALVAEQIRTRIEKRRARKGRPLAGLKGEEMWAELKNRINENQLPTPALGFVRSDPEGAGSPSAAPSDAKSASVSTVSTSASHAPSARGGDALP